MNFSGNNCNKDETWQEVVYTYLTSHTKNPPKSTHANFRHFDFKMADILLKNFFLQVTHDLVYPDCFVMDH